MRRRPFNFAAAVSMILLMTATALWVLGRLTSKYRGVTFNTVARTDGRQFHYSANSSPFGVTLSYHGVNRGTLTPGWLPFSSVSTAADVDVVHDWYASEGGAGVAGVWWLSGYLRQDPTRTVYEIFVSHWVLTPLLAVLPLAWCALVWRRRRLRSTGCCATCGYDLRATPDRCPECGAAPLPQV